ncbi:MAG: DUF4190 domain-containing protein, partial [Verrucomicrobiales bacterium]|nr:DUF4190 domain-containing protein [Verrucomicrobiales bacterium]
GAVGFFGSFLCFLGFLFIAPSIAAVICAHIALQRIKKFPQPIRGRRLAISGLLTGYFGVIFFLAKIAAVLFLGMTALPDADKELDQSPESAIESLNLER